MIPDSFISSSIAARSAGSLVADGPGGKSGPPRPPRHRRASTITTASPREAPTAGRTQTERLNPLAGGVASTFTPYRSTKSWKIAASSLPASISFWAMAFMSSRDEHCSWLQVPTGKLHPPHWQISPSAMDFTVGLEVAPRAFAIATAATRNPLMIAALRIPHTALRKGLTGPPVCLLQEHFKVLLYDSRCDSPYGAG